ncbi:SUKH-4 family immunity protein [Streptomyces sp. NPDC050121]|uniref:SUKH-4 family immunity protein n=1 Tax=Streptomyces sp. NPDC050121 TaxID=3365601 RepID=UPI00379ED3EA
MVTHAELVDSFGENQVSTLSWEFVEQHVTDADARRVLSEVGLPESLLDILAIGDFRRRQPPTLGEMLGSTSRGLPNHTLNYLVIATGMGGAACLNGSDGRVYWFKAGDRFSFDLINSSLDLFVEMLHRIWCDLEDLDLGLEDEDDEDGQGDDVADTLRRLVTELRPVDPESFESPVKFWQHVILFALRHIAEQ